ncbi:MAG: RDD family protein, partial [Acidobacteria bacterium]|nr:RDD family protein [Acidobacteriota bacterium]
KKLVGLKAVNRNGQNITWEQSAKRNLPFFLPSLIALVFSFIPVLNVIIAFGVGLLGLLIVIVELLKVVSDKDGLRIGDLFAETRVVEVPK